MPPFQMVVVYSVFVLSRVRLCVTLGTAAWQAPRSMGFPRQEDQGGLPFPPLGDLPDPGIKPASPALAGGFLTTSTTREALVFSAVSPGRKAVL